MKTLRFLLRGGQVDERPRRDRKISLPANQIRDPLTPSHDSIGKIWQNFKRKLSFSVSNNESVSESQQEKPARSISLKDDDNQKQQVEDSTDSPKYRRGNSQVGDEDIVHFAIVENDIELLKSVLKKRTVNVNYLRPPGIGPLHQACITGSLEMVEILVRNGANIFLRDSRNLTPLQLANINGHFEIAEYLLRMGSPVVDIKDGFQLTKARRKRSSCFRLGPH